MAAPQAMIGRLNFSPPTVGFPVAFALFVSAGRTDSVRWSVALPDSVEGEIVAFFDAQVPGVGVTSETSTAELVVPRLILSSRASLASGRVRLVWTVGDTASRHATLYRRVGDDRWTSLARLEATNDTLSYEDATVPVGIKTSYRLGIMSAGHELYRGAIDVNVPGSIDLATLHAWPNPAAGAVSLAFALGSSADVRVEMFDVAGRQVLSRPLGTLPSGVHTFELNETRSLEGGIYFLRVRKGGATATRRVCLLR
jgi:hypothetical protein